MHKIPGVQFVQIVERIAAYVKNPPATAALGRQVFGWAGKIGTIRHRKYLKMRKKLVPQVRSPRGEKNKEK
jgi:hypothetical protein